MADHEVWKDIPGCQGYQASSLGRIRSLDRWVPWTKGRQKNKGFYRQGVVLKQFTLVHGYHTTHLGTFGMNKYVHRLVALAFLGKPPRGMDVCHVNGNKSDNRLTNLRFGSRFSNMQDAIRHRYEKAWEEYGSQNPTGDGRTRALD